MKPVDLHLVLCFLEIGWVPLLYGEPPVSAAVGKGGPAGTEDSGDEPGPEPGIPLAGDSPGDEPLEPEPGALLAGDSPDDPVAAAPEPAVYHVCQSNDAHQRRIFGKSHHSDSLLRCYGNSNLGCTTACCTGGCALA